MSEYFILFFLSVGALTTLIAAIGLLKMPDIYLRMSASTIAGTFGVASMLIAAAIHFWDLGLALHVLGVIIFLILTVPVGAHLMGRAAYIIKLDMWEKTMHDAMKDKFDHQRQVFLSPDQLKEEASSKQKTKEE